MVGMGHRQASRCQASTTCILIAWRSLPSRGRMCSTRMLPRQERSRSMGIGGSPRCRRNCSWNRSQASSTGIQSASSWPRDHSRMAHTRWLQARSRSCPWGIVGIEDRHASSSQACTTGSLSEWRSPRCRRRTTGKHMLPDERRSRSKGIGGSPRCRRNRSSSRSQASSTGIQSASSWPRNHSRMAHTRWLQARSRSCPWGIVGIEDRHASSSQACTTGSLSEWRSPRCRRRTTGKHMLPDERRSRSKGIVGSPRCRRKSSSSRSQASSTGIQSASSWPRDRSRMFHTRWLQARSRPCPWGIVGIEDRHASRSQACTAGMLCEWRSLRCRRHTDNTHTLPCRE